MAGHPCVYCTAAHVPRNRAVCGGCAAGIPVKMGEKTQNAWKFRQVDPVRWQETVAQLLDWRRNN